VGMVREDGRSVAAAARDRRISARSAKRFLRYFFDTGGDFHYDPVQWNRHFDKSADDPQLRDAALSTVRREPELFLDEMADAFNDFATQVDLAVEASPATLARVLGRKGYMRKIVERAFITRNDANRVAWVAAQWRIPHQNAARNSVATVAAGPPPLPSRPPRCPKRARRRWRRRRPWRVSRRRPLHSVG